MRHVVSVSIGSSTRDKRVEAEFCGEKFLVERIGVDGDLERARQMIGELDGKVAAIGLGGIDLYLIVGGRRYVIRDAWRLAQAATRTPVVDGSGLKNTWERVVVERVTSRGQLHKEQQQRGIGDLKVLVTSAVDRFGMAEALGTTGCRLMYGDLIFALGLPAPLTRLWQLRVVARLALPVLCRQPFERLYPTGKEQEAPSPRYRKYYQWADVIAGDTHFVKRFMPPVDEEVPPLAGKTILSNTTTKEDVEQFRRRGVARIITTTPRMDGRSFGTNVMEGVVVALLGKEPRELSQDDYMSVLERLGWEPSILELET